MKKIPVFFWSVLVGAGLLVSATQGLPVWAKSRSSGYEGLLAPEEEEPAKAPAGRAVPEKAGTESGYQGLIAPDSPAAAQGRNAEPPGYYGVMPGYVRSETTELTPIPGQAGPPRSAQDLQLLATGLAGDQNGNGIPDDIEDVTEGPPLLAQNWSVAPRPRRRIHGELPLAAVVRRNVNQIMASIRSGALSDEEREKSVMQLQSMASAIQLKRSIPDRMFKKMGASSTFLHEEREGTAIALQTLNEALRELK